MNTKEHLETIEKVKRYLHREDYASLVEYIKEREIEVRISEDKASNYIDALVERLK